jgi:thiosulfate dehydrogenase
MRVAWLAVVVVLGASACAGDRESFAQHGADLARSPAISNARYNAFACTTCHAERARETGTRIYPGAPLEGAARRPSWWGGNVLDLHAAVDDCFEHFMQGEPLDPNRDTGQALVAYLEDLARAADPATTAAVPFTTPATALDLPPGDATLGADLYHRACETCHGAKHTGAGRLGPLASVIPDDTLNAHLQQYGPACTRVVFVEKVRHGSFLGVAGSMPPFSTEVLSDAQVAEIPAYLKVPTGGTCAP